MSKNILVLAGRLDDSVLAIGGIIRKYTNAGHKVSVVCFGCGDEGFATLEKRGTCTAKFYEEALAAHKVLGVEDFICHNLSDFEVNETKQNYRWCMEAIRRVKPDVIFGHYWLEYFLPAPRDGAPCMRYMVPVRLGVFRRSRRTPFCACFVSLRGASDHARTDSYRRCFGYIRGETCRMGGIQDRTGASQQRI